MKNMRAFSEWVFRIEKGLGGFLLLLILCLVFFSTIGRYTGLYNMAWSDEASRYCMIWSVFLLAGLSAFRGQMFSIDIIGEKLPLKGQRAFVIIRLLLMIAFCAFAILYGWNLMMHQAKIGQTSPSLKLPMWFMYSCVPLGCLLLLIHYAALAWVQLTDISRKIKEGGQ
ncbi:MAG: TRAP transporter small permease [Lachnospiraceae bacterium]|nr:TRAP transporter small permease [Lachnospiraceae bacterium]